MVRCVGTGGRPRITVCGFWSVAEIVDVYGKRHVGSSSVQKCRGKGRADLVDLDKEAPPCKAVGRPSASFSQFVGVAPAWVRGVAPLLCIIGLPQRSKARLAYRPIMDSWTCCTSSSWRRSWRGVLFIAAKSR